MWEHLTSIPNLALPQDLDERVGPPIIDHNKQLLEELDSLASIIKDIQEEEKQSKRTNSDLLFTSSYKQLQVRVSSELNFLREQIPNCSTNSLTTKENRDCIISYLNDNTTSSLIHIQALYNVVTQYLTSQNEDSREPTSAPSFSFQLEGEYQNLFRNIASKLETYDLEEEEKSDNITLIKQVREWLKDEEELLQKFIEKATEILTQETDHRLQISSNNSKQSEEDDGIIVSEDDLIKVLNILDEYNCEEKRSTSPSSLITNKKISGLKHKSKSVNRLRNRIESAQEELFLQEDY